VQVFYGPLKSWISGLLLPRQRRIFAERIPPEYRPAVLIVAAKGAAADFPGFLQLVMHQNYPDYRLVFVTESADDPAALAARTILNVPRGKDRWVSGKPAGEEVRQVDFVVAGLSENEGQKVHNLRAAIRELRPGDRIVAFADADIVGNRDWLSSLLAPLNLDLADLSSGYRWFVPKRDTLANRIAMNLNGDIAMLAGPAWCTLLWGGSMAMTRETFDELNVPAVLEGSLNDDLQITRIAREHGKRMLFVRGLMAPSPVDYDWSSFLEFARRQYLQVRVYVPLFWWLALGFTSLWLAGFSVTLYEAVQGAAWAWWVLLTVAGCNLLAHRLKNWQLRMLFPPEIWERIRGGRSIGWFTITLNFLLHWAIVASVAFKRDVTWAGIHYRIKGRQRIEVLGRNS
jgi:cellulose synthase/poly-beta-1,6-N-acetylglucosamine synthase-like glycosyltransferase